MRIFIAFFCLSFAHPYPHLVPQFKKLWEIPPLPLEQVPSQKRARRLAYFIDNHILYKKDWNITLMSIISATGSLALSQLSQKYGSPAYKTYVQQAAGLGFFTSLMIGLVHGIKYMQGTKRLWEVWDFWQRYRCYFETSYSSRPLLTPEQDESLLNLWISVALGKKKEKHIIQFWQKKAPTLPIQAFCRANLPQSDVSESEPPYQQDSSNNKDEHDAHAQ